MNMPLVLTNRRRRGGSASAPAFSPTSLYSSGSQGIWLDPSDLTTMFSDRAGTTPVTAPGTTVGLRLDKSKGLALGAELVTNGTFDSGTTGWTAGSAAGSVATIAVSSGELIVTNSVAGQFGKAFQAITCVVGKSYQVSGLARVVSASTGRAALYLVGSTGTFIGPASNEISGSTLSPVSLVFLATATTHYIAAAVGGVGANAGATFGFDNISVRELPGNHAVAPTDAARPIYGVEPKGGRRNLLLATDTLATQSLTVTAVAHTLAFTGTGTVTLSGASIAGPLIGTGASDRVSLTFTPTAASLTLTVVGSVTLGQLELGSSATAYQKVVTAYDITESGVATCHYVQYDGSDDSLSTSSIDFTGTDKMSVFAGVRKLSAADSRIVELSVDPTSNAGAFWLSGPQNTYEAFSRGTAAIAANQLAIATGFVSPTINVVTSTHDIAGDLTTIRVNGAASASATGDQGTGNFGNYPLFIGRRNNATLPFNGKDYGIIVVGKAASAGEISNTETWLAARTAQVTL